MDSSLVLPGVIAYLLLNLALGFWAGRQVRDGADFIVAGRRLPLWLATATLFATWFGGGTCVGAAGAAYEKGVLGVIADPFGAALCLLLAGWFFVRPLRRMRLMTIGDFFRIRYGAAAERIAALLQVPPFIGWAAAQMVAFGTVLQALTGIDQTTGILLGAATVLVYTVAGGMWAVSLTDTLQAVVLIAGLVVLLPVALDANGGWTAVSAALPEGRLDLLPEPSLSGWLWYLQAWLVVGVGSIPSQDLLQRSLSSRSESVAVRSSHIAGGMYLTIGLIPVALGLTASIALPGLEDPELALPLLGKQYLGPFGLALFLGALLSAILSSADSALLAPASVFSENVVRPLWPGMSERALLQVARASVAAFTLLALLLALEFRTVYEMMLTAMEAGVAGMIAPFTAGLYWKRANGWGAVGAMTAGTATWALMTYSTDAVPADLVGLAVSIVVLIAVSLATGRRVPPLPLRDIEGRRLYPAGSQSL
ncbi:MAG: sodium/solute symporter [Acidobacteria bacterium]|nr:sodium/solute symporter [Acidobacteriota bacterium]